MSNNLSKWLQPKLQPTPKEETLDDYLDRIIPIIASSSETLLDTELYVNQRWIEMRDEEDFHQQVLHSFLTDILDDVVDDEGRNYMRTIDADVTPGRWKHMKEMNRVIIHDAGKPNPELYELAFLSPEFFILRREGKRERDSMPKYLVLVLQSLKETGIEWTHLPQLLLRKYGPKSNLNQVVFFVLLLIILVIFLLSS